MNPITESMLQGRLHSVIQKSGIPLRLIHDGNGYHLHKEHDRGSGSISGPICHIKGRAEMYAVLKTCDFLLSEIKYSNPKDRGEDALADD